MADPIVPNFINGVGRLATDRYTYEKHVNGSDDRHKAGQIDLFPTVVIGTPQTTVQDAITAISTVIGTPPPDASTTVKGIVKLAGDIAGTATSVVVTRLQGKPVSSLTPTTGDVLTWDGSSWKPQSIVGTFTNLTVTGNTTLGTNSSNTLLVNAQATLSNNLTVNGNTVLGNANADTTTIQGVLTVSGGNVSITGATSATFAANNNLNLSGAATTTLVSGGTLTSVAGSNMSIVAGTTISLSAPSGIQLNSNVNMNSPNTFSVLPGSSFYVYSSANVTMNAPIIMSGYSKINKRYTNGPNSNSEIFPAQYDVYFCIGLTANREWTINELFGATLVGIEFEVINDGSYQLIVRTPVPDSFVVSVIQPFQRAVIYRASGTRNWKQKFKHDYLA